MVAVLLVSVVVVVVVVVIQTVPIQTTTATAATTVTALPRHTRKVLILTGIHCGGRSNSVLTAY